MGNTTLLGLPFPELSETGDVPRDIKELAEAIDPLGVVPIGAMMMWPTATAPDRWLVCAGQADIPAAAWPKLALVLGETGGFIRMPDLRGRVPLGPGTAAGDATATAKTLLLPGGAEKVALRADESPLNGHVHYNDGASHTHDQGSLYTGGHSHSVSVSGGTGGPQQGSLGRQSGTGSTSDPGHTHAMSGSGGTSGVGNVGVYGSTGPSSANAHWSRGPYKSDYTALPMTGISVAHQNMPPFLPINFIIRAG